MLKHGGVATTRGAPDNWTGESACSRSVARVAFYVSAPGRYVLTLFPELVRNAGRFGQPFRRTRLKFDFTVKKTVQDRDKARIVEITLEEFDLNTVKDLIELAKESDKES